jgi:hypothetical protein
MWIDLGIGMVESEGRDGPTFSGTFTRNLAWNEKISRETARGDHSLHEILFLSETAAATEVRRRKEANR